MEVGQTISEGLKGCCFLALWQRAQGPRQGRGFRLWARKEIEMNLTFWLLTMFLLGIVAMGLMFLFMKACEKI
jgi:hypothetical protein